MDNNSIFSSIRDWKNRNHSSKTSKSSFYYIIRYKIFLWTQIRYKVSKFNSHFLARGEKHWKDLSKEEIDEVIEKELHIQEEKSTLVIKLYFIKLQRIHLLNYLYTSKFTRLMKFSISNHVQDCKQNANYWKTN